MSTDYDGGRHWDVKPPVNETAFDVRVPEVRHQSIGALDQKYLHKRSLMSSGFGEVSVAASGKSYQGYTRVPPLRNLRRANMPAASFNLKRGLGSAWLGLAVFFAVVTAGAGETAKKLFSKQNSQYKVGQGIYKNRQDRLFLTLRRSLALLLVIGALAAIFWPKAGVKNGGGTANRGKTASNGGVSINLTGQTTAQKGSQTVAGSTGNGSASTASTAGSNSSGTSTTSVTGAQGSGSVPSSPVSAAPALPYTVTVPATDVQAGGKRVISTGGIPITLN